MTALTPTSKGVSMRMDVEPNRVEHTSPDTLPYVPNTFMMR